MILALRLARRELRGGVRGLWIVLACLCLGVAAIAAVGLLRSAVTHGLAADGRRILGGDLEIETGSQPPPAALDAWLRARGATVSHVVQMRSMLVAPSGERQLVALKAVDSAWPLVGQAETAPSQPIGAALGNRNGRFGLLADPVVLSRLGLHPGATARLGSATLRVSGALINEPDRVAAPSLLGARVLISSAALPETGLVVPGAIVRYAVRLILPDPARATALAAALRTAFPNEGWRIRDPQQAAPGATRFIEQTGLFLTLAGLTSLLVGGIGVASGVRAWLDARASTIATLRCLGASTRLVFAVCLIQVLALSALGVLAGLILGSLLLVAGLSWFGALLPFAPALALYPAPLLLAAGCGLLTAGCFALWPLARAGRIPAAALFRDALLPETVRPPPPLIAANAVLALALVGLVIGSAADRWFALWFCAAAAGALVVFRIAAWIVRLALRAIPAPRLPWVRLGLSNLHRPGAATVMLMLSLGTGLSTLATVALIEGNLRREVLDQLPAQAPSFFFVDIQNSQLARFDALVRAQPGFESLDTVPSLRARIVAVNGIPADQVKATPETRWALRGDRGLTYAATPPPGTHIVAGKWWPADYDGPPLVSFDAGLARGWGLGVGSVIRVNVLGRDIDLKIASLRDIAWRTLGLNFTMVASPGLLAHAPHTHIATVRVAGKDQGPLLRAVTDALPNVTGIPVQDVLAAVGSLLGQIAAALAATGSVTLVTGLLVMVGAVAAGQRRRVREAVILKSLGATRAQMRAVWLVEFGALGIAAGLASAAVASAASYGVVHAIMHGEWVFLPGRLVATLGVALAIMVVFGYSATAAALRAKAAPLLRNE
jgi:putative ABC transport system permease protein